LYPAVVLVAPAVENDRIDSVRLRALREQLARGTRLFDAAVLALRFEAPQVGRRRGQAGQRTPGIVVDELTLDMLEGAEHHQARPLGRTGHLVPDPIVTPLPLENAALLELALLDHRLSCRLSGLAADLLALVANALALVRLG